jgi:uncharacterized protein VirK/YbjX
MSLVHSILKISEISNARFSHKKKFRKNERLKFILRSVWYRNYLFKIYEQLAESDPQLLEKHFIYEKVLRPYLTSKTTVHQATTMLLEHYQFMQHHCLESYHRIYHEQGIELGQTPDGSCSIKLHYDGAFRREGELCLSLYRYVERLYSCAFIITLDTSCKKLVLRIGGLQGPSHNTPHALALIKDITKACFGERPRDLLLYLIFKLAHVWNISQVVAITNHTHVYQARRYSKKQKQQVHQNYDQIWHEYHCEPYDSKFVALNEQPQKSMEDISSSKRSQYRKRFAWLDSFAHKLELLN